MIQYSDLEITEVLIRKLRLGLAGFHSQARLESWIPFSDDFPHNPARHNGHGQRTSRLRNDPDGAHRST